MSKPRILLQLDGDPQPSVFDAVVAVDSEVDHLFRHGGVEPDQVRDLVYGCMFTRGPEDLKRTAIFIGGSNVAAGEELLERVVDCFFGPMRVSVLLDANGANTTAAAAVLMAGKHLALDRCTAAILAGTGPVGQRAARLLAAEGATVRVASRGLDRAKAVCDRIRGQVADGAVEPIVTADPGQTAAAIAGCDLVIAAGAAGVQLLSADQVARSDSLKVAIDLNAVAPAGIEPIAVTDKGTERDGVLCYGALGVGGAKMKIHKAAVRQLFERNDQVLDAAEVYALGRALFG